MSKRSIIPVKFGDLFTNSAVCVGNNAAWNCICGYHLPLIVSTKIAPQAECPRCGRKYKTNADGGVPASVEVDRE